MSAVELWDAAQKRLIKEQIAPKATDDELRLFAQVCTKTGLDPFSRQIYAIHRYDKREGRDKMTIQCSIDGFRVVAQRSRDYEGQTPKQWCGPDGQWVDVWLKSENPAAARVGVWRRAFREPLYAVATWKEYAQYTKDGKPSGLWGQMPALMLAKCAESLALRAAFPNDLSGLYSEDEYPSQQERGAGYREVHAEPHDGTGQADDHRGTVSRPALPPPGVDAQTGEIIDVVVDQHPTQAPRTFKPPRKTIRQLDDEAKTLVGKAKAVKAVDRLVALKARIAALSEQDRERLGEAWKAAGLPSVAGSGAKLTDDQHTAADGLVTAQEKADAPTS